MKNAVNQILNDLSFALHRLASTGDFEYSLFCLPRLLITYQFMLIEHKLKDFNLILEFALMLYA